MSTTDTITAHCSDLHTVDIGSTVIKFAILDSDNNIKHQEFHDRNYDAEIVDQVDSLLKPYVDKITRNGLVICSSANGGLRVGIICLSNTYSGSIYRNQVLLSGANPVFLDEISSCRPNAKYVDVLLIGGGIDCQDHGSMGLLAAKFVPSNYNYGSLVYAGNRFLAEEFVHRFPDARMVSNPMADGLTTISDSVFVALRDAYLDDLVFKEGISDVAARFDRIVYPTPEVVNSGYYMAISEQLFPGLTGASICAISRSSWASR